MKKIIIFSRYAAKILFTILFLATIFTLIASITLGIAYGMRSKAPYFLEFIIFYIMFPCLLIGSLSAFIGWSKQWKDFFVFLYEEFFSFKDINNLD